MLRARPPRAYWRYAPGCYAPVSISAIRPNATCPPRGARLELCSCAAGALCALVLCTCIKRRYTPRRYAPACWALYAPTLHACTVVCSKLHNGAMRPGDQVLCTFVSCAFSPLNAIRAASAKLCSCVAAPFSWALCTCVLAAVRPKAMCPPIELCSRTLGAIHPNTLCPSKARPLRSGAMRPGAMHLWHMLHAHSELCSCVRRYTARCYYAPLCPGCYTSQTTCSLRALLLRSSAIRPSAMHLS